MSCSIQIIIIDFGGSWVLGFREALGDPRFDEDEEGNLRRENTDSIKDVME